MEKLRDFIGIAVIVTLIGLALLLNYGCKTVEAAPAPTPKCMDLVSARNAAALAEGFKLADKKQGPQGELVLIYFRDQDQMVRQDVYVPKTYQEPPKELNFTSEGDCLVPTGGLFKTFRNEQIVIQGKRA